MARLTSLGNVWNIVRELNVNDLKEQAEQPIRIALVGASEPRHALVRALFEYDQRFAGDYMAVEEYELPLSQDYMLALQRCDMVLLIIDAQTGSDADIAATADQIVMAGIPALALVVGADALGRRASLRATPTLGVITLPQLDRNLISHQVAPDILNRLPEDQRIAAARAIPALREPFVRRLIGDTSSSNATYALTSGIPQMVPLLNIPLNAADLVVLTKNQALMVYKMALAFGAPSEFQNQMREVLPVVGGSFVWRQIARQLVGLIPGLGILPKVAVAYAGTYATGQAALRWYRSGDVLSPDALKRLYQQASVLGRKQAGELVARRQPDDKQRPSLVGRLLNRQPKDDQTKK